MVVRKLDTKALQDRATVSSARHAFDKMCVDSTTTTKEEQHMARINYTGGCKVAWETYDNEVEANEVAAKAIVEAERKAKRGYDFGYSSPGEVRHIKEHPQHGECWIVTLP